MIKKRPLLFFTGGMDSTALLYDRLKNHGNVDVMYASVNQHPIKAYAEKEAREKIITAIEAVTDHRVIQRLEMPVIGKADDVQNSTLTIHGGIGTQQMALLLAAVWVFDTAVHSSVEMGIVMGDSSVQIVPDLSAAWRHLLRICKNGCLEMKDQVPPMDFPILTWTKEMVYRSLPDHIRGLTWTCELPRWITGQGVQACGQCTPCITKAAMLAKMNPELPYSLSDELENFHLDHGTPEQKKRIRAARRRVKRQSSKSPV